MAKGTSGGQLEDRLQLSQAPSSVCAEHVALRFRAAETSGSQSAAMLAIGPRSTLRVEICHELMLEFDFATPILVSKTEAHLQLDSKKP
uniref:Uncharacterized protein n=1 Tax=Physcomitrium patens TaxID=3218 RepID=A0A2K1J874_PHYPA|nr:hypothetical protein PHYPA_020844 [Physcomitrium patens]